MILRVTFPKVPRWGIITVNSFLRRDQAWICCLPSEPSSSLTPHPSECVFVSQLKICFISHPMSWSWVVRSSRRLILLEFTFPLLVMLVGVPRGRRRDKDDDRIKVLMKCNLDREDCASFVSPLSFYLTSWISGRDSCLVGVSRHIPSSSMLWAS